MCVSVDANVIAALVFYGLVFVLADSSSNGLALVDSEVAMDATVSVGWNSSLVANFNVGGRNRWCGGYSVC